MGESMIFDSHAHVNTADTARYPVSPIDGKLGEHVLRDALPASDLLAAMDAHGVARAVVVQRAHVYGFDNSYTLDMATAHPDRLAALCIVDGRKPDASQRARECLDRGAIGIRYTEAERGQGLDWLTAGSAAAAWRTTVERGGSIRVHLFRWNRADGLAAIRKMLDMVPETVLVLDHLSNLDARQPDQGIDLAVRALVEHPTTYLLLSMINFRRWADEGVDPQPVVERVVSLFGADRVMWGSDVGNTIGDYGAMIRCAEEACAGLSAAERRKIFHGTAVRVYGGSVTVET